jgi:LPS sulfotransferase NodH
MTLDAGRESNSRDAECEYSMTEQTRFVIFGVQRTGTTLLMSLLDQHPDVTCVGELFQYRIEDVQYGVRRFRAYVHDSPARRVLDLIRFGGIVHDYLDTVYPLLGAGAAGFKIMLDQIRRYRSVLGYFTQNHFKIIHVIRTNILRTHISRLHARQSGIYQSVQTIADSKIRVPVTSLLQELSSLAADNARLATLVSELGLSCYSTTYEKLRGEQWSSEKRELLSFLGVDPAVDLRPRSVKLTPDELELVVANYDEMVRVLEGTPYETYLEG